jgi:hypothetical protein
MRYYLPLRESSFITSAEYEDLTGDLTICMGEKTYIYSGVTMPVVMMFLASDSIGTFYNENIKGIYSVRTDEPTTELTPKDLLTLAAVAEAVKAAHERLMLQLVWSDFSLAGEDNTAALSKAYWLLKDAEGEIDKVGLQFAISGGKVIVATEDTF